MVNRSSTFWIEEDYMVLYLYFSVKWFVLLFSVKDGTIVLARRLTVFFALVVMDDLVGYIK